VSTFPSKILLATDGSPDAALAAKAAADLSEATGAELHLVHAWRVGVGPRLEAYLRRPAEGEAHTLLEGQVREVERMGASVTDSHLREGRPAEEILELCEEIEAGLIVMGGRGLGSVGRLLLGSVCEGVVHHARDPVLVVRGGEEAWPPERVIIGDDGSAVARQAGGLAARIGGLFGARGVIIHVYLEMPEIDTKVRAFDPRAADDALRRAERDLKRRAHELEEVLGSRPQVQIAVGDAAHVLLEEVRDGDEKRALIAVGSRGLGLVGRMRLGSVSTKILRAARGPVLVYPHGLTSNKGGTIVMNCKEKLGTYLRENAVPYQSQHHVRAITAQEVAATEHVPGKVVAKTVMVLPADEEKMVMLVLPAPYHVNPQKAAVALGVSEVRLAEEERFADSFPDCEVGAMPPFGNLYDVPVYVDKTLAEDETIVFRAGTHTDTMSVSYADFERLVEPALAEFADPPSG
jgi:nucleotide-binding universal stress UspA family protein/prolyl-tRNA editing enzyme YbaK/EbsC (Cys-tRNA(Pro) deacylase)